MPKVAVDIMGSDKDPRCMLEGAEAALNRYPELELLVVGAKEYVEPFSESHDRCSALVSEQVVNMEDHPAQVIRTKPQSSIVMACEAVARGEADGLFSAGSTGAIMTAATFKIGRVRGVKRPVIAAILPGLANHQTVVLDLGANADIRPEMMEQFAAMGVAFAQIELGLESPRVALLNNGTEETKGSQLAQSCYQVLKEQCKHFVGNCEGKDILLGNYDVVVSDGYSGNIALKAMEGTARFIMERVKAAVKVSPRAALGALLLKPVLKDVADDLSGDAHGGAALLGLKAPVIVGHGATSARATENGIRVTYQALSRDLVGSMQKMLKA